MKSKKIISADDLKIKLKKLNKKVSLVHGVFDIFHIGHKRHFEIAKSMSNILVVSLTTDKFVNKGPSRPAFNEKLRLEAIAALDAVDFVSLNTSATAVVPIQKLKPDVYCKGPDYKKQENDINIEETDNNIASLVSELNKIKEDTIQIRERKASSGATIEGLKKRKNDLLERVETELELNENNILDFSNLEKNEEFPDAVTQEELLDKKKKV